MKPYGIIYKVTNITNKKCYIGQTIQKIKTRKSQHIGEAFSCRKYKCNSCFHKAIKKYGPENFEWEILKENVERKILNIMETFMIMVHNTHISQGGYNFTWGGNESPMSNPITKKKAKKSIQVSMKFFTGKNNSMNLPGVREKHKKAVKKSMDNPDWKEKHKIGCNKNKCIYEITDPSGNVFKILGLNSFCKKYNLSQSKMSTVAVGQRKHHRGWKCKKISESRARPYRKNVSINTKTYKISYKNKSYIIENLTNFCRENGLSYSSMITYGKCQGYICTKL